MSLSIKIIILGDQYSGKTSLMNKIISNTFYNTYSATIGVDYTNIKYDYEDKIYNVSLWDTSGQEKFSFLLQSYFASVSGAIIVYDITNIGSFNAVKRWIQKFRMVKDDMDLPILVISNKMDLESQRIVSKESLEKLKQEFNVYILETSVKNNKNLNDIFKIFIDDIEMKLLCKKLTPCYENGLRFESVSEKHDFTIEEEDYEKKCCNIL